MRIVTRLVSTLLPLVLGVSSAGAQDFPSSPPTHLPVKVTGLRPVIERGVVVIKKGTVRRQWGHHRGVWKPLHGDSWQIPLEPPGPWAERFLSLPSETQVTFVATILRGKDSGDPVTPDHLQVHKLHSVEIFPSMGELVQISGTLDSASAGVLRLVDCQAGPVGGTPAARSELELLPPPQDGPTRSAFEALRRFPSHWPSAQPVRVILEAWRGPNSSQLTLARLVDPKFEPRIPLSEMPQRLTPEWLEDSLHDLLLQFPAGFPLEGSGFRWREAAEPRTYVTSLRVERALDSGKLWGPSGIDAYHVRRVELRAGQDPAHTVALPNRFWVNPWGTGPLEADLITGPSGQPALVTTVSSAPPTGKAGLVQRLGR